MRTERLHGRNKHANKQIAIESERPRDLERERERWREASERLRQIER